jgi:hypothetical protein
MSRHSPHTAADGQTSPKGDCLVCPLDVRSRGTWACCVGPMLSILGDSTVSAAAVSCSTANGSLFANAPMVAADNNGAIASFAVSTRWDKARVSASCSSHDAGRDVDPTKPASAQGAVPVRTGQEQDTGR